MLNNGTLVNANTWLICAWLCIALLSYFGGLNPYPLGLLSCLLVATGGSLTSIFLLRLFQHQLYIARTLHCLLVLTATFIVISSWYYFDYFQQLYSYQILNMGEDLLAGQNALNIDQHKFAAVVMFSLICVCLIPIWWARPATTKQWQVTTALLTLFIVSLFLTEGSYRQYRENNSVWLHPANIHPLHAFFHASREQSSITNAERSAFEQLRPTQPAHSISANNRPYNLIVILLESFRADLVGTSAESSGISLTPNFDALANQGMIGQRHFSNTTHTVSAELNLWCSIFDLMEETKLAYRTEDQFNFRCITDTLKQAGYLSLYFHGNTSRFYKRNKLLPKLGFDQLFFHKDIESAPIKGTKIGWGVDDGTMFDTMLLTLESPHRNQTPFFAHLTTLSNHYPFRGDNLDPEFQLPYPGASEQNSLFENYQNMIAYTDFELGKFWQKFILSDLASNTMVVVTSDHGIWEFGELDYNLAEKNERFFRAPLFIYHPQQVLPTKLDSLSSHIDIAPTLLTLLGLQTEDSMLGRDLLHADAKENWVIANKGSETLLRTEHAFCFLDIDECAGRQQECKAELGVVTVLDPPQSHDVCWDFNGDLLNGGQNVVRRKADSEYDTARLYRKYLNKTVLAD